MIVYRSTVWGLAMLQDGDVPIPLAFSRYYNWEVAGPIVLALQAFQRNIPEVSGHIYWL